jgi:DNA primase small subunit
MDILKYHFQDDILEVQDPWQSDERAEKLLQLLPDRILRDALRKKWNSAPGRASRSKWADIDSVAKSGVNKNLSARSLLEAKQDIVLEYTYPRLDIEVSKKRNHLLKSPFVVHPGTGRVCVPIDTKALTDFDPLGVPTVQSLLREIDAWGDGVADSSQDSGKAVQDWEKTSLKPYVDLFRSFVAGLLRDEVGKVKREGENGGGESMEF